MMTSVTSNASKLAAVMGARADAIMREMRAATTEAKNAFVRESKLIINRGITSKPVPTEREKTATGGRKTARTAKPLWIRTGLLARSEKGRVVSDTEGRVENAAVNKKGVHYPRIREEMPESLAKVGKKWRHGDRTAHFRQDVIREWQAAGKPRSYYQKHLEGLFLRTQVRG